MRAQPGHLLLQPPLPTVAGDRVEWARVDDDGSSRWEPGNPSPNPKPYSKPKPKPNPLPKPNSLPNPLPKRMPMPVPKPKPIPLSITPH